MWAAIVIVIVYAFFVFALFVDDPHYRRNKSKSGCTGSESPEGLRNISNEEDNRIDKDTGSGL